MYYSNNVLYVKTASTMLGAAPAVDYKLGEYTHISIIIMLVATVNDLPDLTLPAPVLSADFRGFILYILVIVTKIASYSRIPYTSNL